MVLVDGCFDRFWSKATLNLNGCLIWTASVREDGYGQFTVNAKRRVSAHRFAYELANGPIPAGLSVLHRCDVPLCVNPEHLFLGTQKDNCQDAVQKGRNVFGMRHGRAKLNLDTVREARKLHAEGWAVRALARRFGVAKKTMTDAIDGTHWKCVQEVGV